MTVIVNTAATQQLDAMRHALNGVLAGKPDVVEMVLTCLLARGHLLIEDLPGLGKTTLAKALAQSIQGKYARVQCTPDLLPTDLTGFNFFNPRAGEFEFRPGCVFADVLLADEINRATPRTQSALFEAMAERQVTLDGDTRRLSPSFFLIATQNPLDSHGAYPLPEAQLDRFAMKLSIGYPDRTSEARLLEEAMVRGGTERAVDQPSLDSAQLSRLQDRAARVMVGPRVRDYLLDLAQCTRNSGRFACGLSPRGLLLWQSLAQALAFLQGRDFVTPDDIQHVAKPTLVLRLAGLHDSTDSAIDGLLAEIPVPVV